MMTPDVAVFLRDLLARQTVQVGAPDFDVVVALAGKAVAQLTALAGEPANAVLRDAEAAAQSSAADNV